ncbi:hypothetical protein DVR12_01745 [Chitinophaga silvatica]|uniref:Lipocalin-like domain-containing protein n=1 Tax=Chitinophaga silvatica TaxID=2282649 RepID=A0A3E1YGN8_9BACT|nr:hypothetical protein [Chitinophaga silvatica]RFS26536.1 hypothetical protein DVR12_01745 [Chitinophaga silvatica]
MKFSKVLLVTLCSTAIFSCKKSKDANIIEGNWRFVGIHADANTQASDPPGTTFSNYTYDAQVKSGDVTIDGSKFSTSKLSYSINTVLHMTYVEAGETPMTMDMPWNFEMPESSSAINYRLIGTDSIYFENGVVPDPTTGGATTEAYGARISWSKDTLVLKSKSTITKPGASATVSLIQKLVRR